MVVRAHNRVSKLAFKFGLLGIFGLCLGLLSSVLAFEEFDGKGFDFLNHTLSELGYYGHSYFAVVLNGGLFFGGLSLVLFCLFSLQLADTPWLYPFFTCLALAFFALVAVGLFPINVYHLHTAALKYFFVFGCLSIAFYGVYLGIGSGKLFGRWTMLPAIVAFVLMLGFLAVPLLKLGLTEGNRAFYLEMLVEPLRPQIWWPAIFEWFGLATFMLWTGSIVWSLKRELPS